MLTLRRAKLTSIACALVGANLMAATPPLLSKLAGQYTYRFKNGDVSGATYDTTDVVKIYPVSSRRALISFELNFFNGHSCTVYGVANVEGPRLVYRERSDTPDEPACELRVWRDRTKLRWEDGGSCRSHCGARGGLSSGEIAFESRRPLRTKPESPLQ